MQRFQLAFEKCVTCCQVISSCVEIFVLGGIKIRDRIRRKDVKGNIGEGGKHEERRKR